jgi:peptidylprolyl isomerase
MLRSFGLALVVTIATLAACDTGPTPAVPADVAAPPADASVTQSGLASKVITAGAGTVHPTVSDTVTVHYSGWTTDGKMFDSSVRRGEPTRFGLTQVIPGWTEGLQLMVVGETRRLWIPEALAYRGQDGRPAGMLVFDVELLAIE